MKPNQIDLRGNSSGNKGCPVPDPTVHYRTAQYIMGLALLTGGDIRLLGVEGNRAAPCRCGEKVIS
jgi:hypothetical protein